MPSDPALRHLFSWTAKLDRAVLSQLESCQKLPLGLQCLIMKAIPKCRAYLKHSLFTLNPKHFTLNPKHFTLNPKNSLTADGPQQKYAATLINEVCGEVGCQFVLGMGDNFYPCGADAFDSGLNRFVSGEQSQASPSCVDGAVVCFW